MNQFSNNHRVRTRSEQGFTLIELLIVLIIVAILMAFAVGSQDGAKKVVKQQDAIVAAHSLQKAVEGFRRDREGRVPSRTAPIEWDGIRGPVDLDTTRPYMQATWPTNVRMTATAVFGGSTVALGSYTPTTPTDLSVTFEAIAAVADPAAPVTTYRITVRDGTTVICTIRNDQTAGSETC